MNVISKQVAHLSFTMDYLSECYIVESAGALLAIVLQDYVMILKNIISNFRHLS